MTTRATAFGAPALRQPPAPAGFPLDPAVTQPDPVVTQPDPVVTLPCGNLQQQKH